MIVMRLRYFEDERKVYGALFRGVSFPRCGLSRLGLLSRILHFASFVILCWCGLTATCINWAWVLIHVSGHIWVVCDVLEQEKQPPPYMACASAHSFKVGLELFF